ncbi:MAG: glyceraldehyde-3-phosphate dehydrogenase [Spirochaetia bacterium]|jgi:glyceraldehyde 3-phosphate dehydrogenase|nr:glyceraldehyde-3-phosphate dehydrogenase [Spirochaetia bacterium]
MEKLENYNQKLNSWISDEKTAAELINVSSMLRFDKTIELIILGRPLNDIGAGNILASHLFAEKTMNVPMQVQNSLKFAKSILANNVAPARIDIARLNREWHSEKDIFENDPEQFIKNKLAALIGAGPRNLKDQDVVIYGFGRIGRLAARELITQSGNGTQLRLRAIVTRRCSRDDLEKRAELFLQDSVHGKFPGVVTVDYDNMFMNINGHNVKMLISDSPENLDYAKENITKALLIDSTGMWRDREGLSKHLEAKGISKVILTAPGKGNIPNIVYGVNQEQEGIMDEKIVSSASCTTNAIVPALSLLENKLGIAKGHLETIHSYTNDQNLLDNYHKNMRRGRSAPLNMVITDTGAAKAAVKAIPSLQGKLTASAIRVPTPNVSLAILMLTIKKETTLEEVNSIFYNASIKGELIEQIRYSNSAGFVSSDGVGENCTSIYDSPATQVSADGKSIVIYLWYDNEYGYTKQVIRLAKHICGVKRYRYY